MRGLEAPRLYQFSIGIERQVTPSARVTANWVRSRGTHLPNVRNISTPINGADPFGDRSVRLLTESAGASRQDQFIVTPNVSYKRFTLSGFYALSCGDNDNEALPADPYNLRVEWGPSTYGDVRHRLVTMSSIPLPWRISAMPFFVANSGVPYNITTGLDPGSTGCSRPRDPLWWAGRHVARSAASI